MPDLNDTFRALSAAHPHMKIKNLDVLDPVKQAAKQSDPKWNRKVEDEKKRSVDEIGHLSRCSDRTRQYVYSRPGQFAESRLVDVPTPSGKPWVMKAYKTHDDRYTVHWVDSGNIPEKVMYQREMVAHLSDENAKAVVKREGLYVVPKPQVMRKVGYGRGFNAKRAQMNGGRLAKASGEVISESMVPPPEQGCDHITERWRADGRLQKRKMGSYEHEVAVFKSRKHMEASQREFNRDSPDVKMRNKWGGEKAEGANSGRYE